MCNRYVPEKLYVLNYIVKYKIPAALPSVIQGMVVDSLMKSIPCGSQRNYAVY